MPKSLLRSFRSGLVTLCCAAGTVAQANPAGIDWQTIGDFSIARSETTVAQFRRFVA